jgi:hypothetical protein
MNTEIFCIHEHCPDRLSSDSPPAEFDFRLHALTVDTMLRMPKPPSSCG